MPLIYVNVRPAGFDLRPHWESLAERASPNVFMDPAALDAATDTEFAKLRVLLAWDVGVTPKRLVGLWALQERALAPLLPAYLDAPAYNYAFVSSPVVDRSVADEVVAAFFAEVAKHPSLPKVLRLKYLDGGCETYGAIRRAASVSASRTLALSERERPFATRLAGIKRSGSTRKKLRQDWNRLSAVGTLDVANDRAPEAVRDAFETFLTMEAKSWKGERGTALLSNNEDAVFTRRMIGALADKQSASVALLRLDGRPVAAQVLLYSGSTAYTWKTAFDAEFAKFSPGALLVDKVTELLFEAGNIEAFESCSPEASFMAQLWEGRRPTVDLLVDVGPRKSLGFEMAVFADRSYRWLKELRDRLRRPARPREPLPSKA
jgi:CelD/BcsL family acetyltransferase involved in cellulose biosynthesis